MLIDKPVNIVSPILLVNTNTGILLPKIMQRHPHQNFSIQGTYDQYKIKHHTELDKLKKIFVENGYPKDVILSYTRERLQVSTKVPKSNYFGLIKQAITKCQYCIQY